VTSKITWPPSVQKDCCSGRMSDPADAAGSGGALASASGLFELESAAVDGSAPDFGERACMAEAVSWPRCTGARTVDEVITRVSAHTSDVRVHQVLARNQKEAGTIAQFAAILNPKVSLIC